MWSVTFEVKIKRYHAYNGIFAEQYFRSSIDNANQTITFCGFGYHHQNSIFEIKVQTLTLGVIKFLLREKIYCTEEITTML